MRSSLIVSILFLAASALSAQGTKSATLVMQGSTDIAIRPYGSCPIAFSGDLNSPSTTELLTKDAPAKDKRPHLQLSFDGSKATAKLLKVHVTVYGSPKGPHVMLVNYDKDNSISENFDLTAHAKIAATAFHSDVYPETMGIAQWAEINQIDYADGSAWHSSSTSTCKVALTGFKRVDSAR